MFERGDHVAAENRDGIVVCYDRGSGRVWVHFSDGTRHLYEQATLRVLEPSERIELSLPA